MDRRPGARGPASAPGTRAVTVGGLTALIAVLGHAAGGAGWPSGAAVVPIGLAGAAAGLALSRVAWTALRLFWGLAAAQVAVHALLWIGSGPGPVDPRLAPLGAAADEHLAHPAMALTPHMLAGHALAIAVTAVVLVSAERAASLLAQLARRLCPLWTHVDAPPPLPASLRRAERSAVVPRLPHLVTVRGHAPPASPVLT